jgi:diguanylate cyclase (GGDEF)-like protein
LTAAAAEELAEAIVQQPALAPGCRAALDHLGSSTIFRRALHHADDLAEDARAALHRIARAVESSSESNERAMRPIPVDANADDCDVLRRECARAREAERRALTELQAIREQLDRVVTLDPMTQTLCARGLEQALELELRRARRTGSLPVAMLLECVNSDERAQRGAVRDRILAEIAGRIRAVLRSSDHVARVGGHEFLMILPETGYWEALRIADRLLMKVTSPVELGIADPLRLLASVGVCRIPGVATSVEQLIDLARSALLKARVAGRVVSDGLPHDIIDAERAVDRLLLEETYRAVREPIVRLEDGRVAGYELLTRTTLAGFEMPADFLQMAFTHNIVSSVDRLCLKACLTRAEADRAFSVDHHVNLFPSTILGTPPEDLLAALGCLPYDKLCVEVTEQQFVGDGRDLRERLATLRQAGVRIALDDVGFGRTSLELLILLEPDVVKIDRRFVKGLATDRLQAAAFGRLVETINALGAVIVAEGIETSDDLRAVRQFAVPYGQGFLWPDRDSKTDG